MGQNECNTIVISAVNLVEGGGLSVLVDCLNSLTRSSYLAKLRIVVLVNSKMIVPELAGVEYIEIPKAKKCYLYRLYYEYIFFYRISCKLRPKLWLSLHDMSPKVKADVQAVYMHNPTPFYTPNKLAWRIAPLTAVWAYLYKYIYKFNVHSNKYLVVQQQWLREEFSKLLTMPKERIIVARPIVQRFDAEVVNRVQQPTSSPFLFLYPSYPRVFKNFEIICEAAKQLEFDGVNGYEVWLTVDGSENKYSRYLLDKYGSLRSIKFIGLRPKSEMDYLYRKSDCLLFPSKLETWGLPLSEYQSYNKPMLVADLPYAHESVEGGKYVRFFDPNDASKLADEMRLAMLGDLESFHSIPQKEINEPFADTWEGLFDILLR